MEETGIPQIKPQSILDPPQIRPVTASMVEDEQGGGQTEETSTDSKPRRRFSFSMPRFRKISLRGGKKLKIALGVLGVFALLLVVFLVIPGFSVYRQGKVLVASGRELKDSVNSQDIAVVKKELGEFQSELTKFQKSYKRLAWTKFIPVAGAYWKDGDAGVKAGLYGIDAANITIETVEPYADIIGFAGPDSQESTSGEDTANDRIEFLVQTIESITPRMDEISEKAMMAKTEVDKIDPDRYPEKFKGIEVRAKLEEAISTADEVTTMVSNSKPLLESAPYLLGTEEERTYLLLFQNDKELRPTGGFLTAYSIINVSDGKIQPVTSSDIYHLDDNYTPSIPAPEPIVDYLKGPYALSPNYRLRDMNWSPDFFESMELFIEEAEKAGIEDIDGVIAVDTHVVVNILAVLGQIGVPGFGNFSTENDPRCDCPQVIYELESFADVEGPIVWSENEPGKIVFAPENYDNRKKIVGPLMNSILSNALGQPKEKLPGLMEAGWKSLTERHVLLYMFDEAAQKGAESFGVAGKISDFEGDYLHINDSNLGGRKSNLYVTQEVSQDVTIKGDGTIEKTLTITYKNPKEQDGWLNSVLPNWTRIYVPKGSELISEEGFEDKGETYEELGKTVFSGGFELRPQGVKQIVVTYRLPFKVQDNMYTLMVQKQPGTDKPLHIINVGKKTEELFLTTDKIFKFKV